MHAVKFMCGLFACGDLFQRRFGRGDGKCGSCPDEKATVTLDRLLEGTWREREGYRRSPQQLFSTIDKYVYL